MNILPLLAGLTSLVMALAVMFSKKDSSRYPFVIFSFGMSLWAILISVFLFTDNNFIAESVARVYYFAAALIFYGFLLFCISFTGRGRTSSSASAYLILLLPLVLIGWIIFMPGYISISGSVDDSRSVELDPVSYIAYTVYVVSFLVLSCMQLARVFWHRDTTSQVKSQIRMIGLIALLCLPFGGLFNLVLPYLGNYDLIMLGPLAILPVIGITFYSIKQHGLFDIKSAAVRTVAYILSLSLLAALYYLVAYLISTSVFRGQVTTEFSVSPLNILLALVLAFLFQPVKIFFDKATDRVFYRNRYDTGDFLIRLGRILTSTTELDVILEKVSEEIRQTLKAGGTLFLVFRDNHPNEFVGEGIDKKFSDRELADLYGSAGRLPRGLVVVGRLKSSKDPVEKRLYDIFSKKAVALAVPLVSAEETVGYFMLSEHRAGTYSQQDIDALEAIVNELIIAVQNARSVQALRDLNVNLEQRIESATSKLLSSNEKLRHLDATKDEFISMASHQLRTPLTSVKGYISMVLEGDAGDITPMQKKLLEEAFISSERMVHLIGDFLNVSRLQTGKFVLDKTQANLSDLVEEEVDTLKATAKSRDLKLEYDKPEKVPELYIDDGKIHQVVMNFIDNAIYYSPEDSTINVRVAVEAGDVVFEVKDAGMGVPEQEQAQLFTKFFRATNAKKQRPDGTGIGLYLAKKVIDAHGGKMIFKSTEGEGSTFGFRLPIKKLSEEPS